MHFLVEDASGGRHWANAAILDNPRQHQWLRDWEGLDMVELPGSSQQNGDAQKQKTPSWFLEEWMKGNYD